MIQQEKLYILLHINTIDKLYLSLDVQYGNEYFVYR